jgi:hypothetical protein
MLKEVFVIQAGVLQYHYSVDQTADDSDQAVLSSGLLSALRDFSKHTRSDSLESFSTENEYFLFTVGSQSDQIIVAVFDRRAPTQVSSETLERVKGIIDAANLPSNTGQVISNEKKLDIRQRIERTSTQLFGKEGLGKYIEEILAERTDIPLAFLVDSNERKVLAHFARPQPLFNENQVSEFLLLHATLLTSLPKVGLDAEYRSFVIESSDYAVSSCRGGRLLSVASGAMRASPRDVEAAALQMCYDGETDTESLNRVSATSTSECILFDNGIIKHEKGNPLPSAARVFLSTLVNNIDTFFKAVNRRKFASFEVRTSIMQETAALLVIERSEGNPGVRVGVYRF